MLTNPDPTSRITLPLKMAARSERRAGSMGAVAVAAAGSKITSGLLALIRLISQACRPQCRRTRSSKEAQADDRKQSGAGVPCEVVKALLLEAEGEAQRVRQWDLLPAFAD